MPLKFLLKLVLIVGIQLYFSLQIADSTYSVFLIVLFLTTIPFSGLNFCPNSKEYTHGVVIRFQSRELSCLLENLVTCDLPF